MGWDDTQDPIEDIKEGIRVLREKGKAPDRMIFLVTEDEAKAIEGLRSCDALKVLIVSGHPIALAMKEAAKNLLIESMQNLEEAGKRGSIAGHSLRSSLQKPIKEKDTCPSRYVHKKNKREFYKLKGRRK